MNNANETYLSGNNANVWWLGGYGREVHQQVARGVDFVSAAHTTTDITHMPRLIAAGLPDPKPWALGFFILFTGTVALTWWFRFGGSPEARAGFTPAIAEALALQLYGATMLLTQVHENHAYGAAALLGVAWWMSGQRGEPVNKELLAIYLALSGVVFFNLLIFYGLGQDLGEQVLPRHLLWLDSPVLLSAINLGVFGWWLVRWIRPLPIFRREAARLSGTAV